MNRKRRSSAREAASLSERVVVQELGKGDPTEWFDYLPWNPATASTFWWTQLELWSLTI